MMMWHRDLKTLSTSTVDVGVGGVFLLCTMTSAVFDFDTDVESEQQPIRTATTSNKLIAPPHLLGSLLVTAPRQHHEPFLIGKVYFFCVLSKFNVMSKGFSSYSQ